MIRMPPDNYRHVTLVAVGTSAARKLGISGMVTQLNSLQGVSMTFTELPAISRLPLPDKPAPFYTSSNQYASEQLIDLIKDTYGEPKPGDVICAAIDHEIYNELFSTIDVPGRIILISLRNSTLHQILQAARSTLEQYVLLEMSLQLLSARYRSLLPTNYQNSEECAPPWHLDRRQCLFDYFGISPQDTSKLRKPDLCESCQVIFTANGDLLEFYQRIAPILRLVARRPISRRVESLLADPVNAFILGAVAGAIPSLFNSVVAVSIFAGMLLLALLVQVRRSRAAG